MAEHNQVGIKGEELALNFLKGKNYQILETNWRFQKAEIDIIASYEDYIIFVEVKTRSSNVHGTPEEAVTLSKQKNLVKAANAYLQEKEIDLESRFDVIAIISEEGSSLIEHIEEAFYPLI